MSTKESLYHNIGDFSTHLSTHFILDILYAVYFLSNYDENYHNRIQKSGDLESLRSSTNPIISSGEE